MTEFRIRNDTFGNDGDVVTKPALIKRIADGKIPTYEIINEMIRYNFDIDAYCNRTDFDMETATFLETTAMEYITDALKEYSGIEPIIRMATSHTNNYDDTRAKYSVRYYVTNLIDKRQNIKSFVENLNYQLSIKPDEVIRDCIELPDKKIFDESVYNSEKKMRCVNTSKSGQNRPLILKIGNVEDTIINNIEGCVNVNYTNTQTNTNTNKCNYSPIEADSKLSDVDYLLCVCIRDTMCSTEQHKEWNTIGQILKNELKDEATQPFVTWTTKFGSENKVKECVNQITKNIKYTALKDKKRLTMKTLHYYAKLNNPEAYNARFKKICKSDTFTLNFDIFNGGEYNLATFFVEYFGFNFKCVSIKDKNIYKFTSENLWDNNFEGGSAIREIISNQMTVRFNEYLDVLISDKDALDVNTDDYDKINRKIKMIGEIILKLGKTNDKNNILREILDKIEDVTFENDLNKEEYMLPIKNKKMLNMKTLETTDRTIKNKFDYECDADYIDMTEEDEAFAKQYFLGLFCNKEPLVQTVLDILKSIFTGVRTRYIYFFTGDGCNGKSLLFKLLKSIFQKSMDTIDTNVIIDQKISSQLTTQLEKLDKCRVGYVTELNDTMKLNEPLIKKITGGDAIDFRGLFKKNVTIYPTCNLCALTNVMPQIKIEKAITDRLIKIPFLNNFPVDITFETTILSKKDIIFSYLMKYGVIRDKFNLTEEMIISRNETIEDNIQIDYLQKFIESSFDIVPFVKKEKVSRDGFRDDYNIFLKGKSLPMDKSTDNKFTRLIRKYGIGAKESNGKTYYTNLIPKVSCEDEDEGEYECKE